MKSLLLIICVVLGSPGCRASASASGSVESGGEKKDLVDEPIEPAEEGAAESDLESSAEQALLGARHDLRLAPSVTTASCKCLAVSVGAPNNPAFAWSGEVPAIDPESQLVIALGSEGMSCTEAAADSLGASYWGYRRDGNDVIVIVEGAKLGRPITTGAIIPRPFADGRVRVRPASKTVPYGRPLDAGQKDCTLAVPGQT